MKKQRSILVTVLLFLSVIQGYCDTGDSTSMQVGITVGVSSWGLPYQDVSNLGTMSFRPKVYPVLGLRFCYSWSPENSLFAGIQGQTSHGTFHGDYIYPPADNPIYVDKQLDRKIEKLSMPIAFGRVIGHANNTNIYFKGGVVLSWFATLTESYDEIHYGSSQAMNGRNQGSVSLLDNNGNRPNPVTLQGALGFEFDLNKRMGISLSNYMAPKMFSISKRSPNSSILMPNRDILLTFHFYPNL